MNSNAKIIVIALVAVLATGTVAVLSSQSAAADYKASDKNRLSGDLTSPDGGNPFGGDDVGDYSITTNGHMMVIRAQADIEPSDGMVLEG